MLSERFVSEPEHLGSSRRAPLPLYCRSPWAWVTAMVARVRPREQGEDQHLAGCDHRHLGRGRESRLDRARLDFLREMAGYYLTVR